MNRTISENFQEISHQIAQAEAQAGRAPGSVTLVAVSKVHSPEAILEAVEAGALIFGENRVQEARAKIPLLPSRLQWHLIGHLQSNKVRQALPLFERIHSVDSLDLARDINRIAGELGLFPKILLEVNVAGESTKFGFKPDTLREQMEEILKLDRLALDGLMAIPPFTPKAEESRPYFVALRECRDRLAEEFRLPLSELSMGMSHDFPIAIAEGSTFVRIGTALFGERRGKAWKPTAIEGVD